MSTPQHHEPIVIIGATGKTGRRLTARLRAADVPVRSVSRSTAPAFDWHKTESWGPVLQGCTTMYLTTPDEPVPVAEFVSAATAAGIRRIVALSGRGRDIWPVEFGQGMRNVEDTVATSGAEWTILRPNNFNQNFDEHYFHPQISAGSLALPTGNTPEPFIDAQDVADVAARLLTHRLHLGEVLELSGGEGLTWAEAVSIIAKVSGRPVRFVDLGSQDYHKRLLAEGSSAEEARAMTAMFTALRQGQVSEPTEWVRRILHREPTGFTDYAVRAAAAGAWR